MPKKPSIPFHRFWGWTCFCICLAGWFHCEFLPIWCLFLLYSSWGRFKGFPTHCSWGNLPFHSLSGISSQCFGRFPWYWPDQAWKPCPPDKGTVCDLAVCRLKLNHEKWCLSLFLNSLLFPILRWVTNVEIAGFNGLLINWTRVWGYPKKNNKINDETGLWLLLKKKSSPGFQDHIGIV